MADYELKQTYADGTENNVHFSIPENYGDYKMEIIGTNDKILGSGNFSVSKTSKYYYLNINLLDGTTKKISFKTPPAILVTYDRVSATLPAGKEVNVTSLWSSEFPGVPYDFKRLPYSVRFRIYWWSSTYGEYMHSLISSGEFTKDSEKWTLYETLSDYPSVKLDVKISKTDGIKMTLYGAEGYIDNVEIVQ